MVIKVHLFDVNFEIDIVWPMSHCEGAGFRAHTADSHREAMEVL